MSSTKSLRARQLLQLGAAASAWHSFFRVNILPAAKFDVSRILAIQQIPTSRKQWFGHGLVRRQRISYIN